MVIAFTVVLFIWSWVRYEFSYDRFHSNADRIVRFTIEIEEENGYQSHFARCWQDWTREMADYFPQIRQAAYLAPLRHAYIRKNEIKFTSGQVYRCNPGTFDVFDIEIIKGNKGVALTRPHQLFISESLYNNYFGGQDVVGNIIEVGGSMEEQLSEYELAGIFRDLPPNSHFHPEIILSYETPGQYTGWAYVYFLLNSLQAEKEIIDQFPSFAKAHIPEEQRDSSIPHFQKISDIHLYSNKDREIEKNGNIEVVQTFIAVGIIILILSVINYLNITFALLLRRYDHFILRRILGSSFRQLALPVIFETSLILLISGLLSLLIFHLLKPSLMEFLPLQSGLHFFLQSIISWLVLLLITFMMISGPQVILLINSWHYILRHSPVPAKGSYKTPGILKFDPNKLLVIAQFSISFILIAAAIYIHQQKEYMFSKRLGEKNGPVIVIPELSWKIKEKNLEFIEQLRSSHLIKKVTASLEPPSGYVMDAMSFELEGMEDTGSEKLIYVLPVEDKFLDFYDIPLEAGQNFSHYDPAQKREEYILNESAVKYLGFEHPDDLINREFKLNFQIDSLFYGGTIRGVVKDFNLSPLHEPVKPLVLFQKPFWYNTFLLEIDPGKITESINYVRDRWNEFYPDYYFDYIFSNDLYRDAYRNEILQVWFSSIFTILAIVIASIGLAGMSLILMQVRYREIGIRKVHGASSTDVFLMLMRDFTTWVLFAILTGAPVSYLIIEEWSFNYPDKIPFPYWIYGIATFLLLCFAWLSVGYQVLKASGQNAADVLRYE